MVTRRSGEGAWVEERLGGACGGSAMLGNVRLSIRGKLCFVSLRKLSIKSRLG